MSRGCNGDYRAESHTPLHPALPARAVRRAAGSRVPVALESDSRDGLRPLLADGYDRAVIAWAHGVARRHSCCAVGAAWP
jgi:hypothetical protein